METYRILFASLFCLICIKKYIVSMVLKTMVLSGSVCLPACCLLLYACICHCQFIAVSFFVDMISNSEVFSLKIFAYFLGVWEWILLGN